MPRFHFTLVGLLSLVTLAAFGCAALRFANDWWASATFTLCLGIVLTATLRLCLGSGERTFLAGFALFGWAYLFAVFGPWTSEHVGPRLVTTKLIALLEAKVAPQGEVRSMAFSPQSNYVVARGNTVRTWNPATGAVVTGGQPMAYISTGNGTLLSVGAFQPGNFASISHSLLTLVVAFLGGLAAMVCAGRRLGQARAKDGAPSQMVP